MINPSLTSYLCVITAVRLEKLQQGSVIAVEIDQRLSHIVLRNLTNEKRVIRDFNHIPDAALEPCQDALQQRRAREPGMPLDCIKPSLGLSCERYRQSALLLA